MLSAHRPVPSNFARIGTVGANVKSFKDTVKRGKYVYRVQAFNGATLSSYSNSVTVRVK